MKQELINGILVLFVSSLIATFIGFYSSILFKKIPIGIIGSIILSTLLIYIFDFLFFDYIFFNGKEINHSIKVTATIGAIITLLSYLLESYKTKQNNLKDIKVSYPLVNSIIFSGVIIFVYGVISLLVFEGEYLGTLNFMFRVLFINFLVIFILSLLLFKYVYENFDKRVWIVYILYFSVFLFFFASCYFSLYKLNGAMNIQNFLSYLIVRVPFLFMIMLIVQISYMIEYAKSEKKMLTQQSLESQLNYQQLKNQLSPHFLFNNINVLTSLIEENPKKAVSFSENLSHIYRYFLEQEKQDVVLVKDEIEFAKNYLELLKGRFEIGLNFAISIDVTQNEKYIVSTILQQVLENVIKHNEINEDNEVDIRITSENNFLVIENNKNPKLVTIHNSKKGIENIRKRVAFFTDEKVIIENTEKVYIIKLPILETV